MNLQAHVIILNGEDKTYKVESIAPDGNKYAVKFLNSDKIYSYSRDNVVWLTHPAPVDTSDCHIFIRGRRERNITAIHLFARNALRCYAVAFSTGFVRHYSEKDVDIRRSCLTGKRAGVFDYLRQCAGINSLGVDYEDKSSEGILSAIYSRIDYVDGATAAAAYLSPGKVLERSWGGALIFPFGCNSSQERAVRAALSSQISVIQGPPGTGKTLTILNIIANLLKEKKTVLVVSNNNSATQNVLEKLSGCGLGFLVASLGKKENKEAFIANQPPLNPDLPHWRKNAMDLDKAHRQVKTSLEEVEKVFDMQQRLAICRQELAEVEVEMSHYGHEFPDHPGQKDVRVSSSAILKLSVRLKALASALSDDSKGLVQRFRRLFDRFSLRLRLRLLFDITDELTLGSIPAIISLLDRMFYSRRILELKTEILVLEAGLAQSDADALMRSLTGCSMTILRASLAARYSASRPVIASVRDMFFNGDTVLADYPVVLSTTFSSTTCFSSDTLFDYVIMDEASQVSVETGFLALTCARNAVIVGDTMQLPNVITDDDRESLDAIRKACGVPDPYDAARHSFLSSVLAAIPAVPETLLREHYRCHPDIINFCNQKFYGGNLLIMTRRTDDKTHLMALTTAPGLHCRGHYNQREIDAVKSELMPVVDDPEATGIIAPYNHQVDQFRTQIPGIEAATVHKYQGREKDTIIMSVTDDVISEFADNANLLNVAVSRAKERFCLVVSGNPQELRGNIDDLVKYIRYQQGCVVRSRLRSIFDYLFSQTNGYDSAIRRVSEYDSENLTFDLIEKIRVKYPHLSHIKTLCHYPLRYLIRDTRGLSDRERKYAGHPSTHIDFLIINRATKEPLLAIETDGYSFHNEGTEQFRRDRLKDRILEYYGLSLLRLSTVGYGEEQRIVDMLSKADALRPSKEEA